MRAAALMACLASPAMAEGLHCVATEQCRGDAREMCAPSTLTIDVTRVSGTRAHLWIDFQGPYPGRIDTTGDKTTITMNVWGGGHGMEIAPDMTFLYRGNRNKRFTGSCEGSL